MALAVIAHVPACSCLIFSRSRHSPGSCPIQAGARESVDDDAFIEAASFDSFEDENQGLLVEAEVDPTLLAQDGLEIFHRHQTLIRPDSKAHQLGRNSPQAGAQIAWHRGVIAQKIARSGVGR